MQRLSQFSSFQAFQYRGFGALWTGALVSNIGTWMSAIALGVAVTEQTGKAAWTGAIAALSFLPAVVLAPVAGALADRFERKRYLSLLNLVQMSVSITLAVLAFSHHLGVGWMGTLALVNGCAGTLANPGFVALISELVPPEGLPTAMSLNSAQFNLGRIIGPALATAVFATGGPGWAFVCDAVSFGAVLVALSRLPQLSPPSRTREPLWRGIREGFHVAKEDPGIRLSLAVVLGISFLVAPFVGLGPAYAINVFHRGAETASLFTTCQGIGAVCAALLMGPMVKRLGLGRIATLSSAALGVFALIYWSMPTAMLAAAAVALVGSMYMTSLTSFNTVEQIRAPRSVQARISSLHSMLLGGGYSIGLVVMGTLGDLFGLRLVMGTAALLFALCAVGLRSFSARGVAALEPGQAGAARLAQAAAATAGVDGGA